MFLVCGMMLAGNRFPTTEVNLRKEGVRLLWCVVYKSKEQVVGDCHCLLIDAGSANNIYLLVAGTGRKGFL